MIRKNIIKYIGNPKIFAFSLMWLIVLVFVGTVMQKWEGLYVVQKEYFTYWIKWFQFKSQNMNISIPVPSAKLIMYVMFCNLSCYFLRKGIWQINKLGTTITHMGVILLLVGSGLTHFFSYEGNMYIQEGSMSNYISDPYLHELAIEEISNSDSIQYIVFDESAFKQENILKYENLPFEIEIIDYYNNCEIRRRALDDSSYKGILKTHYIDEIAHDKNYENNVPGLIYKIKGKNNDNYDGIYGEFFSPRNILEIFSNISHNETVNIADNKYTISLRPKRTYLPFEIKLVDFVRTYHPGTETAKSFKSLVILNNIPGSINIQMNEPLRYGGFTFYQAAFINDEITVLAAVKNYGRLFPYISSIIISLGILFHLGIMLKKRFSRKKKS